MIRRKILYILTVAFCAWLMLLYTFQGLRFLLGILLALPAVCLIFLLIKAPRCQAEIKDTVVFVERGERAGVSVAVTNGSFLPLAELRVWLRGSVTGKGSVKMQKVLRGLEAGEERALDFEFAAKHCGFAGFYAARARIYDCLGIFSMPIRRKGKLSVWIMPRITSIGSGDAELILNCLKLRQDVDDGDYQVREYRPGDSPRSIHWKLTARTDELQVREIWPDNGFWMFLHMPEGGFEREELRDAFLDKAFSLAYFIAELELGGFEVNWVQRGELCGCRVESIGDIFSCAREVLCVREIGELREDELRGKMQGCHLEADGRLYFGEQCADEG